MNDPPIIVISSPRSRPSVCEVSFASWPDRRHWRRPSSPGSHYKDTRQIPGPGTSHSFTWRQPQLEAPAQTVAAANGPDVYPSKYARNTCCTQGCPAAKAVSYHASASLYYANIKRTQSAHVVQVQQVFYVVGKHEHPQHKKNDGANHDGQLNSNLLWGQYGYPRWPGGGGGG